MNYDFALFDLDGTLSDPLEGIARSLNEALESFGYAPLAVTEVGAFVGPPIDDNFRRITGSKDPAEIASLVARYRERYSRLGYAENVAYPGIRDSLVALREGGLRMGVCTSKRADFAKSILELFDLIALFEFVDGGDIGVQKVNQVARLVTAGVLGSA